MITHTSINYKSFTLDEREQYLASIDRTLQRNSIILATCNRVEIYQGEGCIEEGTVRHLFELTSGLKSRLIGETSIQGQVRRAYLDSVKSGNFDKNLHKLFQTAIYVGKKVRNLTHISQGAMSHAQATLQILESKIEDKQGLSVALFGVNSLNNNILHFLKKQGTSNVFIGNRNLEKAQELAKKYNFGAFHLSQKKQFIQNCDVLISATSAPHTIIHKNDVLERNKPLTIFDLAVPRDVEPEVELLSNIQLYNLEQVENQIEENILHRQKKLKQALDLVNIEVEKFLVAQKKRLTYEIKNNKNTFAA